MDVNGTRFHLFSSRDDWANAEPDPTRIPSEKGPGGSHVVWRDESDGLTLRPLLYRFPQPDSLSLEDRRGNGRDSFGNFYSISSDERSIDIVTTSGKRKQWWPSGPGSDTCATPHNTFVAAAQPTSTEPLLLRGLAITRHQYLVVGVPEPAQLLVFDLHGGGPPAVLSWPGPKPFFPWDFASREDGGVWLLETDPFDPAAPTRYWGLDRFLRFELSSVVEREPFLPTDFKSSVEHGRRCVSNPNVVASHRWPIDAQPVAIESMPDDTILLLEIDVLSGSSRVVQYRDGVRIGEVDVRTPLRHSFSELPGGFVPDWVGHDFAFVPEPLRRRGEIRGSLFLVGQDGNQCFVFALIADEDGLRARLRETYFPLRNFGGRGLFADKNTTFYDLADRDWRWLPVVARPKPRYERAGTLTLSAFDGREQGCVWHRIVMDACIPAGTTVSVQSRAANTEEELDSGEWMTEPRPYRRGRGAELPYYQPFTVDELRREGIGTWELLLQKVYGRFLQLRITLTGTGRSTPRLFALRAYYPRFSYLRNYLPDVYQGDANSTHFLDRFLANVEGVYTDIEGRIANVESLFDERLVEADYLDWLAGWLGTVLDPAFDEARRRLFIRHAYHLFTERGTLTGLLRALRLALDPCPTDALFGPEELNCDLGRATCKETLASRYGIRIIERFRNRASFRRTSPIASSGLPRHFIGRSDNWKPEHGVKRLHEAFVEFLTTLYGTASTSEEAERSGQLALRRFSPTPPEDAIQLDEWRLFVGARLDKGYAEISSSDVSLYREFLQRRYRHLGRLNDRYGTSYADFDDIELPVNFPTTDPALTDWMQFATVVVPIDRRAAQFEVHVPIDADMEAAAQAERLTFVQRLVEKEKPAHTEFEVKPYWALFRVGHARVGLDTIVDRGSRFHPLLLPGALGAVTLGGNNPWNVRSRFVTDRDAPDSIL